jgi:hypothetical protein
MKKYFTIHVNDESSAEFPENYDWEKPNSASANMEYIRDHKKFPEFVPDLVQEIYDDNEFNKINDFVFSPIDKYCISKKVKDILTQFNLPEHKFYPVKVFEPGKKLLGLFKKRKRVKEEYFAFHYDCQYISNTDKFIDFERTKITKDNLGIEQSNEVFFNDKFDHSLDLFEIKFSWMTYVSEELKNKFLEAGVTSIEFSEINDRQYLVKRPNPKLQWN